LNNNTCHFPNCQKIFQHYKKNSGWYVTCIESFQELFADKFVDFSKDRGLFRTFANPFEASYEEAKPASQLILVDLQFTDELRSKYKEGDLLFFYKCLPKGKYLNVW